MNKIKIEYRKTRNKMIQFIFVWAALLVSSLATLVTLHLFQGINIPSFAVVFTALGGLLLWKVRKIGNEIKCTNCNTVLASEIASLRQQKRELTFCPVCGQEIEIN